jgi:hypothetical protein
MIFFIYFFFINILNTQKIIKKSVYLCIEKEKLIFIMKKNSLFHQNKPLFFSSLFCVILILVELFYGYSFTQMVTTQKENIKLKKELDSLKKNIIHENR